MHRVFTGTHESIEERKGVVRNMEDVRRIGSLEAGADAAVT